MPFVTSHDTLFSISFGESRSQKKPHLRGWVKRSVITDHRVLIAISKHLTTGWTGINYLFLCFDRLDNLTLPRVLVISVHLPGASLDAPALTRDTCMEVSAPNICRDPFKLLFTHFRLDSPSIGFKFDFGGSVAVFLNQVKRPTQTCAK